MEEYDLIVVGAGSGNSILDQRFDSLKIALLDDGEHFGGTCLNYGCIPTKMLLRPATLAYQAKHASKLGVHFSDPRIDWQKIRSRTFSTTDDISAAGLEYRLGCSNIDVYRESYFFIDQRTLQSSSGHRISGEKIVIAAGSRPRLFGIEPDNRLIYTSAEIMRIEQLPESLVILGGGVVAVEMATFFSGYGVDTTTVNRSEFLLSSFDTEVAKSLTAQVPWKHIGQERVQNVSKKDSSVEIELSSGTRLLAQALLLAQGRVSNADKLRCRDVGFDIHSDGRLKTDKYQRVLADNRPLDNVFALGDVSDPNQLKHIANHQARIVGHNLLNGDMLASDLVPPAAAVFSEPQVAWVGTFPNNSIVVRGNYSDTAYGWAFGLRPDDAFVKLFIDKSGVLNGAFVIGPEASIIIQPLIQAVSLNLKVQGLARSQYWPHPAGTEVVENALLKAEEFLRA
ncbi:mycothione reductase [Tropheryma whipplei]|uniref:mycothione reductase n=1 Tax=Tropheryma whipplei TaxID=2039 RepID=UPI0004B76B93|nr:mycothione reductase [Tropheryma whipplei]